ncbi:MAG: hypothetical protein OEO21_00990 [Candidatus Krumholzibacteria bacterium]|nr:hypothetical protein [Candidatus Krumholzibacteria bacterium]
MRRHFAHLSPRQRALLVAGALAVLYAAVRVPFLQTFDAVTSDGTHYLGQARSLLTGEKMRGAFPIGYPVASAIFHLVFRDLVLAGRAVSFLAGFGATLAVLALGRRLAGARAGMAAAAFFAVNPTLIRLSLQTYSEALYLCCLLWGIWLSFEKRWIRCALVMGMAVITRSEVLAVFGVIWLGAVATTRAWRRLLPAAAIFVALFALNSAVLSSVTHQFVVVPKTASFGKSVDDWRARETILEVEGDRTQLEGTGHGVAGTYVRRMPRELLALMLRTSPLIFFLGIYGATRKPHLPLLAGLVPFFFYPFFAVRTELRFLLPYMPFLILFAVTALSLQPPRWPRRIGWALAALSVLALPLRSVDALTVLEDDGIHLVRDAARRMANEVEPGSRIADRKTYFAFYTNGTYVEIPVGPYEETLRELDALRADWLVLMASAIYPLRPALRPLLFDVPAILGETRWRMSYFDPGGILVYGRTAPRETIAWHEVPMGAAASVTPMLPLYSPDGRHLAWRAVVGDTSAIVVDGHVAATGPRLHDPIAWSPDGQHIAFATSAPAEPDGGEPRRLVLVVELATGEKSVLVDDGADARSPSWCATTGELFYVSDAGGEDEVWMMTLQGHASPVTSGGGKAYPAVSPAGDRIACLVDGQGVLLLDRKSGGIAQLPAPVGVAYPPAWHPDGNILAVTANDWGSWDIYFVSLDNGAAIVVTRHRARDMFPAWHPTGARLALVSERGGEMQLWEIEGLSAHLERLTSPPPIRVLLAPPPRDVPQ